MARKKLPRVSEAEPRIGVLVDTNVILDVVLARAPWDRDAALLFDAIATGAIRGFIAGHAVTTTHYVVERERSRQVATSATSDVLQLLTVVPIESADFQRALTLGLKDFEDAVQVAACLRAGADFLVTRNARDYRGAPIVTRSAGEVIAMLRTTK